MPVRLGVMLAGRRSAREIAAHSSGELDRPLGHAAELWVAVASDEARLLGAFQRRTSLTGEGPLARRGSGGPEVRVGEGTVHVALALAHPSALVPSDPKRLVNRSVRPLLRAISESTASSGALAHYFGRDWIAVGHRPAAWVGFAHDATSHRTLFEAYVAVRTPFADAERRSYRGREPGTLASISGTDVDPDRLVRAIVTAYSAGIESEPQAIPASSAAGELPTDPDWRAVAEIPIGVVGAGPDAAGILRLGGDLLVSRDALAALEARAAVCRDEHELSLAVDATLGRPDVALEGAASLTTIRDVLARALGREPDGGLSQEETKESP